MMLLSGCTHTYVVILPSTSKYNVTVTYVHVLYYKNEI